MRPEDPKDIVRNNFRTHHAPRDVFPSRGASRVRKIRKLFWLKPKCGGTVSKSSRKNTARKNSPPSWPDGQREDLNPAAGFIVA